MDEALIIFSDVLRKHLSKYFSGKSNINPIDINQEKFRTRAIFTAAIIFLKNNDIKSNYNIVESTNFWLKTHFSNKNLFSTIIDASPNSLVNLINNNICNLTDTKSIDLCLFYESLLSIETSNEDNETIVFIEKNYRNKLGSYYTPRDLSKIVTGKTINSFIDINLGINNFSTITHFNLNKKIIDQIKSISFVDFSCGGRIFLTEIICYFENIFLKINTRGKTIAGLLKSIALNISAFDVDCLAIEQPVLYDEISSNFFHSNFLLHSNSAIDKLEKRKKFFKRIHLSRKT